MVLSSYPDSLCMLLAATHGSLAVAASIQLDCAPLSLSEGANCLGQAMLRTVFLLLEFIIDRGSPPA